MEITNFRPRGKELSSAEYIKKRVDPSYLNMNTTHGLGSGIYGIIGKDRPNEIPEKFLLHNPLVIDDNIKDMEISKLSVWLILECQSRIKEDFDEISKLNLSTDEMNDIKHKFGIEKSLKEALDAFVHDYENANPGDFLKQPINYLLQPQFDGIYNISTNGNQFNRGSVAFIDENPRDQKQAFGSPFLSPGNVLIKIGGRKTMKRKTMKRKTMKRKTMKRKTMKRKTMKRKTKNRK